MTPKLKREKSIMRLESKTVGGGEKHWVKKKN